MYRTIHCSNVFCLVFLFGRPCGSTLAHLIVPLAYFERRYRGYLKAVVYKDTKRDIFRQRHAREYDAWSFGDRRIRAFNR